MPGLVPSLLLGSEQGKMMLRGVWRRLRRRRRLSLRKLWRRNDVEENVRVTIPVFERHLFRRVIPLSTAFPIYLVMSIFTGVSVGYNTGQWSCLWSGLMCMINFTVIACNQKSKATGDRI